MFPSNSRTPFLDLQSFSVASEEISVSEKNSNRALQFSSSPFVSVYELEDMDYFHEDPQGESFVALANDLYSTDFEDALEDLFAHSRNIHDGHLASGGSRLEAERILSRHFAQLIRESENAIGEIARRVEAQGRSGLDDTEVDFFVEELRSSSPLEPAFEQFFGKFKRKVWSSIKKVGSAAMKVAIGPLLRKLEALVRPLLNHVMLKVVGKLPPELRPVAQQLARKLGLRSHGDSATTADSPSNRDGQGIEGTPSSDPAGEPVQITPDESSESIQKEFDLQLAQAFLANDEAELELEFATIRASAALPAEPVFANLDDAREQFIQQLDKLKDEESPEPYIQQFIPAILPALQVGIRLVGRGKIIDFLARFTAKLVQKLVGPQHAPALSRAIVDLGLRSLQLETNELEKSRVASAAVAATIEETVNRVASLPDQMLEDNELLEAFALEAFEHAAAANLPALFSDGVYRQRPELIEGGINAAWILLPLGSRGRYKKCTNIFKVKVTPQMASEIESFEDETLADHLQDQLGLQDGENFEAEVHLYETLPGTSTADIIRGENGQLEGNSNLIDSSQLHLLTREAASTLLGLPALGRNPAAGITAQKLPAGQRLYSVLSPGRRIPILPHTQGARRMRRQLQINVVFDTVRDQLRVCVYLSEVKAQKLVVRMRQNAHHGSIVAEFARLVAKRIPPRLMGQRPRRIRIIQSGINSAPEITAALQRMAAIVPTQFITKTQAWLVKGFSDFIRHQAAKFQTVAEQPEDGVTLVFTIERPSGLKEIGQALAGRALAPSKIADTVSKGDESTVKVDIYPGRKCE
jgi:hypothetical protein